MKLYVLKTTDPYLNLAIEEYLFKSCDDSVFILWQNYNTVVIGKNQNVYCEVNSEFLKKNNIKVARRITGGGAVYHDLGNINYSFISKASNKPLDFKTFTEPIISLLRTLGVCAELSGRNDIMVGDKKISGNAQFSNGERVLHHGTILFDSDLSVLSDVLKVDPEKIKNKAIKSTRSRVANLKGFLQIDISAAEFMSLLSKYVVERFGAEMCNIEINDDISALAQRNSSSEWIYPERDYLSSYTLKRKKRFDFGTVEVDIGMSGEDVKGIKIFGDFFGNNPIDELEGKILNNLCKDKTKPLDKIDIDDYIYGIEEDDFLMLLNLS